MAHACHLQGVKVAPRPGTEVLARAGAPHFNRTWDHFCSHQYTRMEKVTGDPIITQNQGVIYVARPLFQEYAQSSHGASPDPGQLSTPTAAPSANR